MIIHLVFLGPALGAQSQSNLVHGNPVADWERQVFPQPFPLQEVGGHLDDFQNFINWEVLVKGRYGDGTAIAADTEPHFDPEYSGGRFATITYMEQWNYVGEEKGHLEGNPQLTIEGSAELEREDPAAVGKAGAQGVGYVAYESNTVPTPVVAKLLNTAAETDSVTVSQWSLTFSALFTSVTIDVPINVSSGWTSKSETSNNQTIEFKCTNTWIFKSTCQIGVEAFADSSSADQVLATGMVEGSVNGTVTLSELDEENCP